MWILSCPQCASLMSSLPYVFNLFHFFKSLASYISPESAYFSDSDKSEVILKYLERVRYPSFVSGSVCELRNTKFRHFMNMPQLLLCAYARPHNQEIARSVFIIL